jgi:hypothetical protein
MTFSGTPKRISEAAAVGQPVVDYKVLHSFGIEEGDAKQGQTMWY